MFNISKSDTQKALGWLEKKWPAEKRVCECCGNKTFIMAEDTLCGNTKRFNAVLMGLVESREAAEKRKQKESDQKKEQKEQKMSTELAKSFTFIERCKQFFKKL